MNENLKAFMQKASEDSELKEKVTAITGSFCEAKGKLIKIAEDYGYSFTAEDLDAVGSAKEQLSEDELCAVAGGCNCECDLDGEGVVVEYQYKCVCIPGGSGM